MQVSRDETAIDEFLSRGVEQVFPAADFVRTRMLEGKQLSMYLGVDPTGPTLHLGHVVPLRKLAQWQALGHKAILLIGDFTATIGDPTDKMAARVPLTHEQVLNNAKSYKEQASRFLDFGGDNPAEMKYNSEWLEKLSFKEVLDIASHVTLAQTIKRDMFQKRIEDGKDVFLHEFLYPIMQGYDSVAMKVDGEIGGNDQMFNMLMGRDLPKKMNGREKFVVTTKLLTDSTGTKMGKSEGNMVAFTDSPTDMFGKVMSWPDSLVVTAYELLTNSDLELIEKRLGNENPRDVKMDLAQAVTTLFSNEEDAIAARDNFITTFSQGKIPKDIQEIKGDGNSLVVVLVENQIVSSKTDFRRLVLAGAISIDGEKISNIEVVAIPGVYKVGKQRFVKIL